jgi:hypothetical protein
LFNILQDRIYNVHVATGSPIAAEAVRRIGEFYAIEDRIRGKSADIRCAVRQAETKPLMEDFKLWLDARLGDVSQKSGLADAIRYALSHWEGLTRFLSDGRIEIDSNTVERTTVDIRRTRHGACRAKPYIQCRRRGAVAIHQGRRKTPYAARSTRQ